MAEQRFWWVNQNKTHRQEVAGGFLWSPKRKANGARNQFYENMQHARVGDVVFSFYDTRIQAVGVVASTACECPKPDFGTAGADWSHEGWLVGVEFQPVPFPFRPKDHIVAIQPFLPAKYSPLSNSGDGLQSVYLAEIDSSMASLLLQLSGGAPVPLAELGPDEAGIQSLNDDHEEQQVLKRTDLKGTERLQLIRARRGQGLFRHNVRINEPRCRVTGTSDVVHLRASHIKPWRDSSDIEKVSGSNGLLLAPHVDHLFDRGWISFSETGSLMISNLLDRQVLSQWSIDPDCETGEFADEQQVFLEYHRDQLFQGTR
jgi:putative restriction endonuclease